MTLILFPFIAVAGIVIYTVKFAIFIVKHARRAWRTR
jgi:hypothetical protein